MELDFLIATKGGQKGYESFGSILVVAGRVSNEQGSNGATRQGDEGVAMQGWSRLRIRVRVSHDV